MNDKTNSATLSKDPALVEVTLKKNHTHKGVEHAPGDKIRVSPDRVEWLKAQGTI